MSTDIRRASGLWCFPKSGERNALRLHCFPDGILLQNQVFCLPPRLFLTEWCPPPSSTHHTGFRCCVFFKGRGNKTFHFRHSYSRDLTILQLRGAVYVPFETAWEHYPQWWKIESISPKIRNKTRVPTLTTSIQHSFGSVGHSNQGRKRSKRNPDRKRRSETLTVCRWHDPLHRKP